MNKVLIIVFLMILKVSAETKPNVILILVDDLGYGELGCYNGPVKTPNIDRLAQTGVRCTDGYSAFPVCSPSRAAILMGRYPHRFGIAYEDYFGGVTAPNFTPEKHLTIGQIMKQAGYKTACFGKWNVSNLTRRPANDYGFDRWLGLHLNHDFYTHRLVSDNSIDMFENGEPYDKEAGTWCDTIFANQTIDFIKAQRDHPFFVFLSFQAPHDPIQDPDIKFHKPLDKKKPESRPTLVKMIQRLDTEVGRVIKALKENDVYENTLVIFTSDNGGAKFIGRNAPLKKSKQYLEEGGIRVPFILSWPAKLPNEKTFSGPVHAMDLTATVAAAGGGKARKGEPFDGMNLLPVLTGEKPMDEKRPLYFRRSMNGKVRQSAIRVGAWKVLRTFTAPKPKFALYNLEDDIGEVTNLAQKKPDKFKELDLLLTQWENEMAKTAIPFEKTVEEAKKIRAQRKRNKR